ncbi:ABC transporter substrate-binding protein [Marinobacterium jannaschii]|uniref:ABC transporter substrate-binding protein n=1 Tax=Marinobacterium jannaschii TaxID=64970 RepID=UPI000AD3526B|nr:ABC transporter substrate-binding protein [Marinobacterium jannaschii]
MKLNTLIPALLLLLSTPLFATSFTTDKPATIYMVVWRGCEDACQGFRQYIEDKQLPVRIELRDVARDKGKLPQLLQEARAMKPDLVVTWGTSVTKAIIGTQASHNRQYLGDIPAMFMIVADPIGAGIIDSYERSGRNNVTGIRNRVPEDVQIRAIKDYIDLKKIGVIYNPSALNAALNTQKLAKLADKMDFELVTRTYQLDSQGNPLPGQIPTLMQQLADEEVDMVYVGSSSYNREKRDEFTAEAVKNKLPVASAYDVMVTKSNGLLAVANRYYNVGRLAGNQAEKVLFGDKAPGELPIPSLSRYSMFINMDVARQLELYPPIQLLRLAELVNAKPE